MRAAKTARVAFQAPMEKRALATAETIYDFIGVRMMSGMIPGLARILVVFAEREIRLAGTDQGRPPSDDVLAL